MRLKPAHPHVLEHLDRILGHPGIRVKYHQPAENLRIRIRVIVGPRQSAQNRRGRQEVSQSDFLEQVLGALEVPVPGEDVDHGPRGLQGVLVPGHRLHVLEERQEMGRIGTAEGEVKEDLMDDRGGEDRRELGVEGIVPLTFDYEPANALGEMMGFQVERN